MLKICLLLAMLLASSLGDAQTRRVVIIGSSTAAGTGANPIDSSWVRRFNHFYKTVNNRIDTTYNLAVGGLTIYQALPNSVPAPPDRPAPDPAANVSRAVSLLRDLPVPSRGTIIVHFPTNGYNTYTIPEIMSALQLVYDSATGLGNRCYITTTQPRSDAEFNTPAIKRKLADLKDSILNRFGVQAINFYDGLYNPADSSILATYSAGDGIHLNNAGHRLLYERVLAKNVTGDDILLVSWGSFELAGNGAEVVLTWSTTSETNVSHFLVESAVDGVNFSEVGRLPATPGINPHKTYIFRDQRSAVGQRRYYRIATIGLNGAVHYGATRSIVLHGGVGKLLTVLGNPVGERLRLLLMESVQGRLVDLSGKTVWQGNLQAGINEVALNGLSHGNYRLIAMYNGNVQSQWIVKL